MKHTNMADYCDLFSCGRPADKEFEDMEDGMWIALCEEHIDELFSEGKIFNGRVDLR